MARLFSITICFIALIIGLFADIEHEEHGHHHHHAHDGHDHHDHESHKNIITGSIELGEDQLEKLRIIARRIDKDNNGEIVREEMRNYVAQRIKEINTREADDLIATLDPKHTNKVKFGAYIQEYFGDFDINIIDPADSHARENRRLYLVDKSKWEHLDKDGDNELSYDEFRRFLRPEENPELRKIEIDSMINEYDTNKDGKLSNDEYRKLTEVESGQSESLTSEIDKNNDGFGDFNEFSEYYLPSPVTNVEEETDHLMKECDKDNNGHCTLEEIVNAYGSFSGSQVTDFGADLQKEKDEL